MRTQDGEQLNGTTPAELVTELRQLSHTPGRSDREFMYLSAGRVQTQLGKRVRCESAEDFIADLCSVGLLLNEENE